MSIHRVLAAIALAALFFCISLPVLAHQQPTTIAQAMTASPDAVKAAVKKALMSVNLTMQQKQQIRPMVQKYQMQSANADDATKKSAQEQLMKGIFSVLTPSQQAQFKASMKQSLGK